MSSLDQMDIKLDGIGHYLSDNNLSAPKYQRSYAWEEKNTTDLFKDIAEAISEKEKEYFLGSIVVIQNGEAPMEVVDGQQRLATVTILLAAIRDYFYMKGEEDRVKALEAEYLMRVNIRSLEQNPKISLNAADNDFFRKTVLARPDEPDRKAIPDKLSHKRIAKAAELAAKRVKLIVEATGKPTEQLMDWVDFLDTKAKIIKVLVPSYTNAFTIFETLMIAG